MSTYATVTCDICSKSSEPIPMDMDGLSTLLPPGWLMLNCLYPQSVVPPQLDGVASTIDPNIPFMVAFMESQTTPFQTQIHACPECQEDHIGALHRILQARLAERVERNPPDEVRLHQVEAEEELPGYSGPRPGTRMVRLDEEIPEGWHLIYRIEDWRIISRQSDVPEDRSDP